MIRKAELKDIEAIGRILCQVNDVHAKGRPDIFIEGKRKFNDEELKEILSNDELEFYVYEEDEVCAYACIEMHEYPKSENRHARKEIYVEDLCVDEKYRHQGIATKLLDYISELGKQRGCDALTLNMWACNKGAEAFYKIYGMQPFKTVMEKKL